MSTAIALTRFGGEAPRFSPQLLPDGYAQFALNTKLTSGDLVPYRQPKFLLNESVSAALALYPMIYEDAYYWMMWNVDVDVVRSAVANNTTQRTFFTGDGVPKATDVNRSAFVVVNDKTADYNLVAGDYEQTIRYATAPWTVNLLAAATAGNQFVIVVQNDAASGDITIDPSGAELIDGAATITVGPGVRCRIKCSGTAWTSLVVSSYPYDWFELGVPAPSTAPTVAYDILAKAAAYTVVGADAGKTIDCSATPWTLSLTAAATLGSDFMCVVRNLGTGDLTVDPNGSELINGATTLVITSGQVGVLTCNGTSFTATVLTSGFKAYVYTYVTEWGEESAPSPASTLNIHTSRQRMNLSALPATPPAGDFNIKTYRIYRTNTGTSGTFYQLVVEQDIGTTTYMDAITDGALGAVLPSALWLQPPADLVGLVTLANGMMAGFHNNEVCFCEPYQPHAWPAAYRYSVDTPIVALGAIANSVIITTEGRPYVASGNHPSSVTVVPIDQPYPCTSKRGLVNMGTGVLYPSFEGLVYATMAAPSVATASIFTRDEWRDFKPETLIGEFYDGKYFGNYLRDDGSRGSFVFQMASDKLPLFVETSGWASASYSDMITGAYFFLQNGRLFQWDEPTMPFTTFDWWSKEFSFDKPCNLGAALIDSSFDPIDQDALILQIQASNLLNDSPMGGFNESEIHEFPVNGDNYLTAGDDIFVGATFFLYVDGVLKWSRQVTTNRVFRLPMGYKSDRVSFRVSSNVVIHSLLLAETPYGLENVSGS